MTRKWEAVWLGVATIASLIMAPVAGMVAILSPMVFEPRHNLVSPTAWISFLLLVTFWVVCIAAPYGAWVAFARRLKVLTWMAIAAPVFWVVATVASVTMMPT